MAKSKTISVRFSQDELATLQSECERLQLLLASFIRSSVLMRVNGDLVDKELTEAEQRRRNDALRGLGKNTF